ncbi:MAG: hypothetical protein ACPGVU_11175 [Limisphaerales bacterium]
MLGFRGDWLWAVQPIVAAYLIAQILLWAWKRGVFDYDCQPIDTSGQSAESVTQNQIGVD